MRLTKAQKKKIEELKIQDSQLARLPDPKKEKGILKRAGARLKHLLTRRKVNVKKIEKNIDKMNKEADLEKKKANRKRKKKGK